jgi:hypothetical protein
MSAPISIAHYRIVSKLGEGGMGAVYRATDTRLNRDVAIKILRPQFADDPGRMARFEREAQLLASLNHPNIATIHGVEDRAIVMSSPTVTMGGTAAGVVMGTAGYMSPEQARGQNVDKRADIWAFGAVLYELLTGEQLFAASTVSDSIAAVLTKEPDLSRIPATFRRVV